MDKHRPPEGRRFTGLKRLPDETPVDFVVEQDGTLHAEARSINMLSMYMAEME